MEAMAESKVLDFNEDKSTLVVLGKGKAKEEMMSNLKRNPVLLYGKPMKISDSERYLGDQIGGSLSDSVTATISKRVGRATQTIYEVMAVLDDSRAKVIGGLSTGLLIWESAIIPFLLYNSNTWFQMKKDDMKRLDKLQDLFFS